ncbi:hypothetical protein V6N13_076025 [Hibiscus sabdariffa]
MEPLHCNSSRGAEIDYRIATCMGIGTVFAAVFSQMNTTFVLQGNTMDQHMGPNFKIPSASLSLFNNLGVIFCAPFYDKISVPFARKFTGNERGFTTLQRIGIGLVLSIFAVLSAGILEVVRLRIVQKNNYYDLESIPMSIFWQVPGYFLVGCAEVFTFIGQIEFFYDQAPDAMRSLCSALSLTTVALGNYLSTVLVTAVTKITTQDGKLGWIPDNLNMGHLDYFFWLLAILSLLNFIVYLWIARCSEATEVCSLRLSSASTNRPNGPNASCSAAPLPVLQFKDASDKPNAFSRALLSISNSATISNRVAQSTSTGTTDPTWSFTCLNFCRR